MTIPNMLTLRLFAIPVFLILLFDLRYREALAAFVAAGITDVSTAYRAPPHQDDVVISGLPRRTSSSSCRPRGAGYPAGGPVGPRSSSCRMPSGGGYFLFTMTGQAMEVRPSVAGKISTFARPPQRRAAWRVYPDASVSGGKRVLWHDIAGFCIPVRGTWRLSWVHGIKQPTCDDRSRRPASHAS
jgi:hypothetical protein